MLITDLAKLYLKLCMIGIAAVSAGALMAFDYIVGAI